MYFNTKIDDNPNKLITVKQKKIDRKIYRNNLLRFIVKFYKLKWSKTYIFKIFNLLID